MSPRPDAQKREIETVALYLRVSDPHQAKKDLSIPAQRRALRAYAHERGWQVVAEFVDPGRTGRDDRRPGLRDLVSLVERGGLDCVLVWKIERLARNVEISSAVGGVLRRHGVRLVSLLEPIDDTPQGRFVGRIFESLAEFYSNNLSQDVCRGIAEVARRGFFPHGIPPIGYTTITVQEGTAPRRKLVPDKVYAPVIRRIFQLYLGGRGAREIAFLLNEEGLRTNRSRPWNADRIYEILERQIYTGSIALGIGRYASENQKAVTFKGTHEALVSEEDFLRAQAILASRASKLVSPRWVTSPYLLIGLARCGKCGGALCGTAAKSGRFRYYTCNKYYREGKKACSGVRVPQAKFEAFVLRKVREVILAPEHLARLTEIVNEELAREGQEIAARVPEIDQEIRSQRARLGRLIEAIESGKVDLDDLGPRIHELRKAIDVLEERRDRMREEMETKQVVRVELETVLRYAEKLEHTLSTGSQSERKAFLAGLIERVTVYEEQMEVEYRLPVRPETQRETASRSVLHSIGSGGDERI